MIISLFLATLAIAGTFCTVLGLLTVFYWCKSSNKPSDKSNRINRITAWWLGLTRPEILATSYKFFQQDVMENVNDVQKTEEQTEENTNDKT